LVQLFTSTRAAYEEKKKNSLVELVELMVALIKTPTFYTPTFAFARSSTGSKMPAGTTSGSDAVSASGRV
jgi:hypothetical protein